VVFEHYKWKTISRTSLHNSTKPSILHVYLPWQRTGTHLVSNKRPMFSTKLKNFARLKFQDEAFPSSPHIVVGSRYHRLCNTPWRFPASHPSWSSWCFEPLPREHSWALSIDLSWSFVQCLGRLRWASLTVLEPSRHLNPSSHLGSFLAWSIKVEIRPPFSAPIWPLRRGRLRQID
jgi:hypothetical protein